MCYMQVIVKLSYVGEEEPSKNEISRAAERIRDKVDVKGKGPCFLAEDEGKLKEFLQSAESKDCTKLHIVAHGNSVQVGSYNAQFLAEMLASCGLVMRKSIKKITVHTCDSAVGDSDEDTFVYQLAAALKPLLTCHNYLVVRGSDGLSYTDTEGHNWVWNDKYCAESEAALFPGRTGVPIPKTKEAEIQMTALHMKPKATARPKFVNDQWHDDPQPG